MACPRSVPAWNCARLTRKPRPPRVPLVAVYPKDDFPTEAVYYGSFDRAEIRLVTCGGTFDRVKHYLDNVVVFGHLAT